MQARLVLFWSALLLAAPMAFAHDPPGTPRNYCEDPGEWGVHDYGPPATGRLILLGSDSNVAGDCNGDGIPADFDGHLEYAFGGGWLTVNTVPDCNAEVGHHPATLITVDDVVLGETVAFRVAADTVNLVPPTDPNEPDCGDFQTDVSMMCAGSCTPGFPPSIDGTYVVFVGDVGNGSVGTLGHIITDVVLPPEPVCADPWHAFELAEGGSDGPWLRVGDCAFVNVVLDEGLVTVDFDDETSCVPLPAPLPRCAWPSTATSYTITAVTDASGEHRQEL
jgi:hypothetical protein